MEQRFSQILRDQCKAYFQKRCALTISDDEADEYLDSLADFINAFDRLSDRQPSARAKHLNFSSLPVDKYSL